MNEFSICDGYKPSNCMLLTEDIFYINQWV